jgi:phosphatidylserine/phosphatidylglycerophosphate/cardiolipin synthase-like enzyme
VVTEDCPYVQEAVKLFEADTLRRRYVPALDDLVVSPLNARKQLAALLQDAKQQLLIYDPKISDRAMIGLLEERARDGVEVKIIGRLTRRTKGMTVRRPAIHLHARAIVRDRRHVFIGSQSLCEAELDARREVGIISCDQTVVDGVIKTFEEDWTKEESVQDIPLIPKSGVKLGMFMQSCPKNRHLPRRFMQQLIKLHKSSFSLPRVLAFELDARFSLPSWQ